MSSYLISYDLMTPGKDYNKLFSAIKELSSTWCRCLYSTWVIKTSYTAVQVRDCLRQYIDSNDKLLVVTLTGDAAWFGIIKECSNWLKNELSMRKQAV